VEEDKKKKNNQQRRKEKTQVKKKKQKCSYKAVSTAHEAKGSARHATQARFVFEHISSWCVGGGKKRGG
jgi:hypothetical protein